MPIRLMDGLADPISGAHMVARFRELVPNAPVHELPRVGHYPQMEAPDDVLADSRIGQWQLCGNLSEPPRVN